MNTEIVSETAVRFVFVASATAVAFLIFNQICVMLNIRRFWEQDQSKETEEEASGEEPQRRTRKPSVTIQELNGGKKILPQPFHEDHENMFFAFKSGKGFRYASLSKITNEWSPVSKNPVTGKSVHGVVESEGDVAK